MCDTMVEAVSADTMYRAFVLLTDLVVFSFY